MLVDINGSGVMYMGGRYHNYCFTLGSTFLLHSPVQKSPMPETISESLNNKLTIMYPSR